MLSIRSNWVVGTVAVFASGVAVWSTYQLLKDKSVDPEEEQAVVDQNVLHHYGSESEICALPSMRAYVPQTALDFHKACSKLCAEYFKMQKASLPNRVLDLGCGPGRTSFELARHFEKVIGIDGSHAFIAVCQQLKMYGAMVSNYRAEGAIKSQFIAKVNETIDRNCIHFEQVDIENLHLPSNLGKFGCILAANILEQTNNPRHMLHEIRNYLPLGGILIITSTYDWLPVVAKKNWLGGYTTEGGKMVTGFQALKDELLVDFELLNSLDMPLVKSISARKVMLQISHATIWKKVKDHQED